MIRVLSGKAGALSRPRSLLLATPLSSSFGTLPSGQWGRRPTSPRTYSSSSSSSSTTPAKLAFGEDVPRYPHLQALPLVSRPIFPGLVTSVTLTDEATIDALENLYKASTSSSSPAYISCFLRRKHPTGVSEGGVILQSPEIITDVSDLYETGTFAQIQRLTRNVSSTATATDKNKARDVREGVEQFPGDEAAAAAAAIEGSSHASSDHPPITKPAATLILLAHRRVDLTSVDQIGPPIDVTVSHWPRMDNKQQDDTIRALSNEIISTIREVAQVNQLFRENLQFFPMRVDANDPYRLADFAASISAAGSPEDLQAVLEEPDAEMRLSKALVLLNREREVSRLQQEISAKVEEKMSEAQRKYFLTEQLKSIKKELGMERDDKEALIEKYRKQLSEYPVIPEEVMEVIEAELEKFSTLEKNSPEYQVTRTYLDWLTAVPWSVVTEENYDIQQARKVLDRDHYGLDDVKDTILQFIAIGKLKGSVEGKILCLAGPPGVGKTSIASSIADALGRKFFRFSVGGLSDVSEIKGHRRTYIGAMPGKLIQCLKTTGVTNPVVLIDEIDKLGTGFRGDPASALLEVLDPSQNFSFRDHFLDVPVDISKCLFICTANDLDRIPGPLLDRMEVIRLSGYDVPEKVAIAQQYLVPKSMRDSGLMVERKKEGDDKEGEEKKEDEATEAAPVDEEDVNVGTPLDKFVHAEGIPDSLELTTDAINELVRWYAREAGVRSLAKHIDKITRKLALQVVAEGENAKLTVKSSRKGDTWRVTKDNLHEYVGKKIFTSDRLYEEGPLPHGIVMGLAYTSMGGSALYIETQGIKRSKLDADGKPTGGGSLKVTGQLGDVMKESTQIAYTVARARLAGIDDTNHFFDNTDIHMHVPEGATPKDGPSAGVAMVTSMLSLALDRPIRNDLAMTGEISLTGKVLAVGGIKEKIMGARRAGIKHVILPAACERDYEEIPEYLKTDLEVHYADNYDKVFEAAFTNLSS
jgi:Lon-like ATP-dependent protease